MKNSLAFAAALCVSAIAGAAAFAEYPERPIEMIVAYSPGGGTDTVARTLASFVEKYLGDGATITIVNKPGAGGEIGFTELAKAKPDGYTIGFINTPNILTIPISRETRYSMDEIQAVANVVYDPGAFNVLPTSPFKNLDELVAYAKEHPRAVTYGTTGIGGDDHLAALEFSRQAGIEMTHVPFSGSGDVRAAVLGGHISMASTNISEVIALVDEGQLITFGQMSNERWPGAPDVPTFKEQGYDVIMGSDRGIGAPAGIPEEALNALQEAISKAVKDPEFLEAATKQNLALNYQNADEFQAHLDVLGAQLQQLWDKNPWIN
ncbi:tripartite tricarboxylate transporter substrate binding protein [Celeribacter halophilus]|jgi:tripartite-type tricarboxylate transporter receptor subunit TctC|uniref:tripartite tricarboxylate transporter substrate binding protein n=1 Tax=Celeribacter halophilus TaxID=576117 RepID=UPI001C0976AA|nr:tripartite tricarboxylate transporter substrate binding protein [Celeribacter halophilus]MBU2890827.1 tripartite tricarboxylate transporter substrate binding protein [Celeribacter halophilus]MDO6510008.1 tripartite tricarboxylate transporter substrate binding protein [Celeribacter halophilus]